MALLLRGLLTVTLVAIIITSGAKMSDSARVFTIINNCSETVWPGIIPGDKFDGGGFELKSGQSRIFTAPVGWSGRIWGRTGCKFDKDGQGMCQTGRCGNTLKCGAAGEPPASLAEFTLASPDFYDVSLVDGFNLPISVTPINGTGGNCSKAGCDGDLRKTCPKELAIKDDGKVISCQSACAKFGTDRYCCKGTFGNPSTCQPTVYSKKFKEACPTAYSYAYDDPSSILTCTASDYVITFCATRNATVCTYHDNKLICSGSNGLRSFAGRWWIIIFVFMVIFNL